MSAQSIQSTRRTGVSNTAHFWKTSCLTLSATAFLTFGASRLSAQPDLPVSQLVFEPVPIPAEEAGAGSESFSSLENMPQLVSSEDITDDTLDAATRQQIISDIDDYVAAIGNKEAAEGPYSDQLVQDLFSAGQLHQDIENHEQALDFFERAQNISRINAGPNTVAQAPIIQAKTESFMALGRIREADEAQEGLLEIYASRYGEDSEELVPALHVVGDWNMQAFLARSNIALISGRMNVQNFMLQTAQNGGANSAAERMFNQNLPDASQPVYKLFLAQNHYFNAINVLLKNQNYTHPELLDLERSLMTTSFLRTHQENIVYAPDFYLERKTRATGTRIDTSSQNLLESDDYDVGLKSLQRSLAYISQNEQRTHEQVASAMIAEADWHLLFDRKVIARKKYEEIYEFFAANPAFGEYAGEAVYPTLPVVLPTFMPAPNSREKMGVAEDGDVSYFGYFDVSFSINRQGKTRKVRINGQGGEVSKNMEMRLNEYLRNILFRPRYDREGKLDDGELRLRYYVGV